MQKLVVNLVGLNSSVDNKGFCVKALEITPNISRLNPF